MKYVMKSLKHNGIYVPPYDYKGFSVKIKGTTIKLSPKTEQMAIAWVRKEQSKLSPPDSVFYKNFMEDFIEALKIENPSLEDFLNNLKIKEDFKLPEDGQTRNDVNVDFSEIREYLLQEQLKKQNMTKEEKKRLAQERKQKREELKQHYGYAIVDGNKIEIANWTAEPSCIFAGRGDHPKRGKWKEGPQQKDIILNLSEPDKPPPGEWKAVWEPTRMYIACWRDKLSGKMKYVWFSDSAFLKQNREKEKFDKAAKLEDKVPKIAEHIMSNLNHEDIERRKIATICWLILEVNMRVGDEKDPGEADTVGAITLRPEHIKIEGDTLHFDFLGKDAVRWTKQVKAPMQVIENIKEFSEKCKEYLFEGIDSKKVTRFLNEKMEGLTAKVFRTWKVTKTVSEYLQRNPCKKEDPEYVKLYNAKMANLEAAKVANHKRKVPANFEERLAKKETKLRQLEESLKEKMAQGKKTETLQQRLEKTKRDIELAKETKEYNLGTSLKSYIDPRVYVRWANSVDFNLEKFYSKTLRNKFSWALENKST
ncbi:MAG: DNA topoisomerase I [Candidatus Bathyarchaeia archaeon]